MPLRLPSFLKSLGKSSPPNQAAFDLRAKGDAARDSHDWLGAAQAYLDYLELAPRDFGIWVQLGHVRKESGDRDGAVSAYALARKLNPADPDVIMHYGHLLKKTGDLAGAAALFEIGLPIDTTGRALAELTQPLLAEFLSPASRRRIHENRAALLRQLAANCEGLRPIAAHDIVADENHGYRFVGTDPWIECEIEQDCTGPGQLAELKIVVELKTGHPQLSAATRVYFNDGGGFTEWNAIDFKAVTGSVRSTLVAGLKKGDRLRIDPDDAPGVVHSLQIHYVQMSELAKIEEYIGANSTPEALPIALKTLDAIVNGRKGAPVNPVQITKLLMPSLFDQGFNYLYWLELYGQITKGDRERMLAMIDKMDHRPTFSFVMPTYNTPPGLLRECLDSMLAQVYTGFEICIADDNSTEADTVAVLEEYVEKHDNIKFVRRERNGHISAASNSALALAKNEFVVLIDHDDLIPNYALLVIAHYINLNPSSKILFSDEDKVDVNGLRFDPYFKGSYNKYLMFGHNMVSHIGVYERELINTIGGFRRGLEGSQDYDLLLRAAELIDETQIVHIPHVLYHWRAIEGSTAVSADQKGYAIQRARDAINGHFERTGTPLRSMFGFSPGNTTVVPSADYVTKVSILIPTRDRLDLLESCVESITAAKPSACEIVIIDNGSTEPSTLAYFESLRGRPGFKILSEPGPFNFSALNNRAAEQATGDILCFLNNDTEVISGDWLDRARGLLAIDAVGAVGARLLYEDGTVQHFGLGIGMAEHGVAAALHAGLDVNSAGYFSKARLIQEFSAITAACMFVRKRDFHAAGGFNEDLLVAYNDVDFCLRLRVRGLKIICDPDIVLTHKESRTRGSDSDGAKKKRLDAEAAMMHKIWGETLKQDPYLSPNHALDRSDFALAYPPRAPFPWRE